MSEPRGVSPYTVAFVTLGCAKNLVDSEQAMGALLRQGFALEEDPDRADLVIVNTCGFIEEARQESIDEILRLAHRRDPNRPGRLVVAGCLASRYGAQLAAELPEADQVLGLLETEQVVALCRAAAAEQGREPPAPAPSADSARPPPRWVTTAPYGWLKIAEGCRNPCTFCAIPMIRGPLRSVAPDRVVAEARDLVAGGVRELIVVAQDTTAYGTDFTHLPRRERPRLADLIRRLGAEVPGPAWLRLMYAYPAHVTDDLLEALAETPGVVPYLDMPIQHGSDRMLAAMRRGLDRRRLLELIDRIRKALPGVALRTSVLVGYPGEGQDDFEQLLDLIRTVRFERLGVFGYSIEEGTPAASVGGRVPVEEIARRRDEVLGVQQGIARAHNQAWEGHTVEVMIEQALTDLPPFAYLGRTPWDAPEVDQGIYLELPTGGAGQGNTDMPERLRRLRPGDRVRAEVVGSIDYDLEGIILPEPPF